MRRAGENNGTTTMQQIPGPSLISQTMQKIKGELATPPPSDKNAVLRKASSKVRFFFPSQTPSSTPLLLNVKTLPAEDIHPHNQALFSFLRSTLKKMFS